MFTRYLNVSELWKAGCLLGLLFWTPSLSAEEAVWRASKPRAESFSPPPVRLGIPLLPPEPIIRAQGGEMSPLVPTPPPPPPPPGGVSPFPGGIPPGEDAYNCGAVNTKEGHVGGFFHRLWDGTKRCVGDVTGSIGGASTRTLFLSDHDFDVFVSPVTNPFYFEDPRSLTELRPTFMWQRTPKKNSVFAGGDNFFLNLRGSLALTDRISIVAHRLGAVWTEVQNPQLDFANHFGYSEVHIGPKFTIIRNNTSKTLAAVGLVFELPIGAKDVQQDTGNLGLRPYFSFAQNFLPSTYGSFNFMNTTGYSFGTDAARSDFVFSSFHLDFEIAKRLYPFVEANFLRYTSNGNVRNLNFDGGNVFNFGSMGVASQNELTVALGTRFKFSESIQVGFAGEAGVIGGDRMLDRFRVTFDIIFRY